MDRHRDKPIFQKLTVNERETIKADKAGIQEIGKGRICRFHDELKARSHILAKGQNGMASDFRF